MKLIIIEFQPLGLHFKVKENYDEDMGKRRHSDPDER